MPLTDSAVRHARPDSNKDYLLNDGDGLSLFVDTRGKKKWHFRFSWAGKQSRISLGIYPAISLLEARKRADACRRLVAEGVDPRVHRKEQRNEARTKAKHSFSALFRTWRDFKALRLKQGRQSTLSQIDRIFAKDILPTLADLSIFDITRQDLVESLRKIERRSAFTTAEKCRTWLNQLFRFAMVEVNLLPIQQPTWTS